jgi:LemA protein
MPNDLDELSGPIKESGLDINVIYKQIPASISIGTICFEISLWILGIIPGIVFLFLKARALSELRQLQQRIQAHASQVDSYLEQRVVILTNLASLVTKAIEIDSDILKSITALRRGIQPETDSDRNRMATEMDSLYAQMTATVEAYPNLRSHDAISEAIRQNSYLMKEITAARALYNDSVSAWNQAIFSWPTKQIVAAKAGFTTRIPFIASQEIHRKAQGNLF